MIYLRQTLMRFFDFLNSPEVLAMVVNSRFLLILLVIVLLKFKYATYSSMWLSAFINIPGTLLHESMHFIVGALFNARPTSFDLIPHKGENGSYVMGSVGFCNVQSYNALPSAMAPLLLLPIGYWLNGWYFQNVDVTLFNYLGYILLQTILIENAVPSGTDFRVAMAYPIGVMVYMALIGAVILGLL